VKSAFADVSEAFKMAADLTPDLRDAARFQLGMVYVRGDQLKEAIAEFSILIDAPSTKDEVRAESLLWRGRCFANVDDGLRAVEDYTRAIEQAATPPGIRAEALLRRAIHFATQNDHAAKSPTSQLSLR
jgi:tetratricopeptide (TPR) repeat protein